MNFKINLQYEDISEKNMLKLYMKYLMKMIIDYV